LLGSTIDDGPPYVVAAHGSSSNGGASGTTFAGPLRDDDVAAAANGLVDFFNFGNGGAFGIFLGPFCSSSPDDVGDNDGDLLGELPILLTTNSGANTIDYCIDEIDKDNSSSQH
jgi:hypothetical protein